MTILQIKNNTLSKIQVENQQILIKDKEAENSTKSKWRKTTSKIKQKRDQKEESKWDAISVPLNSSTNHLKNIASQIHTKEDMMNLLKMLIQKSQKLDNKNGLNFSSAPMQNKDID